MARKRGGKKKKQDQYLFWNEDQSKKDQGAEADGGFYHEIDRDKNKDEDLRDEY